MYFFHFWLSFHPLHLPIALGGADFEIIPTNNICLLTTCEQAHFIFPRVLAAPSVADQPDRQVGSKAANPAVSKPGRLCTSEIPKPLSVSLVMAQVMTPPRHHLSALPSEIGELRRNWY